MSTEAPQISDAVKKCCNILKNTNSDTEKFAALFMVTKLVKAKSGNNPLAKKAIFEAIGFDFIKRLLITNDVPIDCPPNIYKSVALSILSVFCNEEELATNPQMLELIPIFLDIVKKSDDNEDLMSITEVYNCLKGIALVESGRKALISNDCINKLCDVYLDTCFQSDETLVIISSLLNTVQTENYFTDTAKFHKILNKISIDLANDQDRRKFELCPIITSFIYNNCTKEILEQSTKETWPQNVYKALTDILQSRLDAKQRNPALILTGAILDLFGIEFLLNNNENDPNVKQFFLLLIQLAAVEIRMQLEDKSYTDIKKEKQLICSCFIILEVSMNYITTDQLELDQKEKQTLYTGLKGAFTAIINLLLKIQQNQKNYVKTDDDKLFLYAIIRVLAAWLAQETSALRQQVYKLLPFILEIANESYYLHKQRRIDEKLGKTVANPLSGIDILRILLPGLCHLTVEDEARQILLKLNEEKVLFDAVEFHWNIVMNKRPPVPRSERLKVLNQPKTELSKELLVDINNSRTAIVSTCNILMNISVLEPTYLDSSPVFDNLLKFILENLSELKNVPENLVLSGNLIVLGLLLMKQLSKKNIKKNDFSICRYIQCTIRFLWDAYVVDESNSQSNELTISITYKKYWMELMELWFLGMQTMTYVIDTIPWISEFTIESGWVEGIVNLLKNVQIGTLQPNLKTTFEDFLCHLCDANDNVKSVLKKADALKVCRNHRLMALGKKLFGD